MQCQFYLKKREGEKKKNALLDEFIDDISVLSSRDVQVYHKMQPGEKRNKKRSSFQLSNETKRKTGCLGCKYRIILPSYRVFFVSPLTLRFCGFLLGNLNINPYPEVFGHFG